MMIFNSLFFQYSIVPNLKEVFKITYFFSLSKIVIDI